VLLALGQLVPTIALLSPTFTSSRSKYAALLLSRLDWTPSCLLSHVILQPELNAPEVTCRIEVAACPSWRLGGGKVELRALCADVDRAND